MPGCYAALAVLCGAVLLAAFPLSLPLCAAFAHEDKVCLPIGNLLSSICLACLTSRGHRDDQAASLSSCIGLILYL